MQKIKKYLVPTLLFFIMVLAVVTTYPKQAQQNVSGRTDGFWDSIGTYLKTTSGIGYDILINGTNKYLNFNTISGISGYGFRDNSGTVEFKNSGGSWAGVSAGGSSLATSTIQTMFSNTATGLTYTNTTGVTSLTSGYTIPLTASTTSWNTTTNTVNASSSLWGQALQWNGASTNLVAATGRTSLGLTDTATLASSTFYLSSNPSSFITASALTPYLSTTTAASTYPSFSYASSSYLLVNPSTATIGGVTIPDLFTATKEPVGFADRTSSQISFATSTRVFTITGNFDTYYRGVKTTRSTATTSISNASGNHFIYYNSAGVLTESTTAWDIAAAIAVPVATVYWNGTTSSAYLGDERHGITMDGMTHTYLHLTVSARYQSGFNGTFNNTNGTTTSGIFWDEDLQHTWPQSTTFTVFNRRANSMWDMTSNQNAYYRLGGAGGTTLLYDNASASTSVTVASYVAYWIFAGNSSTSPIISVMGQRQDASLILAQTNNTYASLDLSNFPDQEVKLLYRVLVMWQEQQLGLKHRITEVFLL
jgi:hypothetical protein